MRRRSESFSSHDFTLNLDPQCIVMRGYLIKSPPLEKSKNRVARWHLRWFMLYDTKKRCDIDPLLEREIKLYYFKDEHSPWREKPKGMLTKISSFKTLLYEKLSSIKTGRPYRHTTSFQGRHDVTRHRRTYLRWNDVVCLWGKGLKSYKIWKVKRIFR